MVERQVVGDDRPIHGKRVAGIVRGLERVESVVGAVLLLVILVLVMIQVIVRFTPWGGWVGTGEIARFSMVWISFILSGYLLGRDQHITLDIFDPLLPQRGRRFLLVLSHLLVAVICAAFIYDGLGLVNAQSGVNSSAANIPMSLVYLVALIGFVLTLFRALLVPFARKGAP